MTNFKEFIKQNYKIIKKVTSANVVINSSGVVVITKSDKWRKETEWDTMYEELKK